MLKRCQWIPILSLGILLLLGTSQGRSQTRDTVSPQKLSLQQFLTKATQEDTEFERILIEELALKYQKALRLPARDLVLSVKGQYAFYLNQGREEPDVSMGLSKLFPHTGTEISVDYSASPRFTNTDSSSSVGLTLSQPIAENAFGRSTRLLDKIVGLEVEVARHQIVEAYEDYMATLIEAYLVWDEAYENVEIGESSYRENLKLLDNIKERQGSSIAKEIDVNKITLQVMAKREKLLELQNTYRRAENVILTAMRAPDDAEYVPNLPDPFAGPENDFIQDYTEFRNQSRTYQVLDLLEQKSGLEVAREADDLLPSINLLLSYELQGEEFQVVREDSVLFAGFSVEWPFPDQVDGAEHELSKIERRRTELDVENTHFRLYTQIRNLRLEIDRERELAAIANEKIALSRSVLEDESENYTYGKVTLNDYIQAVNGLDTNRFNLVLHQVRLQELILEWQRLTDRLVSPEQIQEKHSQ
ncbi:MAG: TolC family protein [Candidatus Omnitrophica bacterium]|nr:TolC family protein [Candidatus Omnitrophota bacterium]